MKNYIQLLAAVLILSLVFILLVTSANVGSFASDNPPAFVSTRPAGTGETVQPTGSEEEFPNPKIAGDYFGAKAKNDEVIGWLAVPDICYYPVVFSGDNDYYLKYDAEKRYTQRGAIFANALGSTDFDTGIVLLHGHNMKDGSMFTQLRKYKGETFFNQCGLVEVFDGKYLRLYQPYTVLLLHDNALMIDVREKTGEEHAAYLKKLAGDSMLPPRQDIQPDYSAPALFMSTCDYTFADARLVIGCYQVSKIAYKNAETTAEATGTTTEETAETAETEETVETGDPAETTNTETVTEE